MSTTSETPGTSPVISGALTEPFLLHDPARAWRVEAGYVDLFLARYLPGGSTGARTHIARFDAGAVLFSFPAPTDQTSRVVLAQPSPEAQVISAERDGLDHVGEAVEQWTVALT